MTTDKSLNHVDLKLRICKIKKLDQMTSKNTFHFQNSMTSFPPHTFLSTQRIHGTFQKSVQWFKGTIYTFPRNSNLKLYLLDNPCHLVRKKMLNIIQVTLPKLKTRNKKNYPCLTRFSRGSSKIVFWENFIKLWNAKSQYFTWLSFHEHLMQGSYSN